MMLTQAGVRTENVNMNEQGKRIALVIVAVLVALALTGCQANSQPPLPTVAQLATVTPNPTQPPETAPPPTSDSGGITTPEVSEEDATPEVTEPEDTGEIISSGTGEDQVNILIRRTPAAEDAEVVIPPSSTNDGTFIAVTSITSTGEAGQYLIDASVSNQSDAPIIISANELIIVDEAGNRYAPVAMREDIQPSLVDYEVEPGGAPLRGYAQYSLPDDVVLSHIEWCLDDACESVIGSVLPDFDR